MKSAKMMRSCGANRECHAECFLSGGRGGSSIPFYGSTMLHATYGSSSWSTSSSPSQPPFTRPKTYLLENFFAMRTKSNRCSACPSVLHRSPGTSRAPQCMFPQARESNETVCLLLLCWIQGPFLRPTGQRKCLQQMLQCVRQRKNMARSI